MEECHRSLLNSFMDKKFLKGGGKHGNGIVCNEFFEMRTVNSLKIVPMI